MTEYEKLYIEENAHKGTIVELVEKMRSEGMKVTYWGVKSYIYRNKIKYRTKTDITQERVRYILKNTNKTYKELAEDLEITPKNVGSICLQYGIDVKKLKTELTEEDDDIIINNLDKLSAYDIAKIIGVERITVSNRIKKLKQDNIISEQIRIKRKEIHLMTDKDRKFIEDNVSEIGVSKVALIINSDYRTVKNYCDDNDIKVPKAVNRYSEEEKKYFKKFVRENREKMTNEYMAKQLGIGTTTINKIKNEILVEDNEIGIAEEQKEYIESNSEYLTIHELSNNTGINEELVKIYCDVYGINYRKTVNYINKKEIEYIKNNYEIMTYSEIANELGIEDEIVKSLITDILNNIKIEASKEEKIKNNESKKLKNKSKTKKPRKFTDEEEKYIKDNIETKSIYKISREIGRSCGKIEKFCEESGLEFKATRTHNLTEDEKNYILENINKKPMYEIRDYIRRGYPKIEKFCKDNGIDINEKGMTEYAKKFVKENEGKYTIKELCSMFWIKNATLRIYLDNNNIKYKRVHKEKE